MAETKTRDLKFYPRAASELEGDLKEEARQREAHSVAIRAVLPPPISSYEVEEARQEYIVRLDGLREMDHSLRFPQTEDDRIMLEVYRSRYEALAAARREQSEAELATESRELAKTNIKLAKSQTLIAGAVAFFTLVQLALGIAQAMKWIKP